MKPNVFRVRVSGRTLSVQRRSRVTPFAAIFAAVVLGFCVKIDLIVLPNLMASFHAKDWAQALIGIVAILFIPGIIVFAVLSMKSGQVLHCGPTRLQTARGSFWFPWKRESFALASVSNIRYAKVRQTKGGPVYGLKFDVGSRAVTVFQRITPSQAKEVLQACRTVGLTGVEASSPS